MRYPEIFAASRDTVQPDGAHLTDPDLIQPGWTLTIPGHGQARGRGAAEPPGRSSHPSTSKLLSSHRPSSRHRRRPPPPKPEPEPDVATLTTADDEVEPSAPGWLVPGLTGAGAVLAGVVLLAVRAHRRTQLRYRRPGQTIAPPPPELGQWKRPHSSRALRSRTPRAISTARCATSPRRGGEGRALPASSPRPRRGTRHPSARRGR